MNSLFILEYFTLIKAQKLAAVKQRKIPVVSILSNIQGEKIQFAETDSVSPKSSLTLKVDGKKENI